MEGQNGGQQIGGGGQNGASGSSRAWIGWVMFELGVCCIVLTRKLSCLSCSLSWIFVLVSGLLLAFEFGFLHSFSNACIRVFQSSASLVTM